MQIPRKRSRLSDLDQELTSFDSIISGSNPKKIILDPVLHLEDTPNGCYYDLGIRSERLSRRTDFNGKLEIGIDTRIYAKHKIDGLLSSALHRQINSCQYGSTNCAGCREYKNNISKLRKKALQKVEHGQDVDKITQNIVNAKVHYQLEHRLQF